MPRLFFALRPDAALRRALLRYRRALDCGPCRPVPEEQLHLTLSYLGEVDERRRRALLALPFAGTAPPFSLCLDTPGWWARSRVAWLAPAPDKIPAALSALVACIEDAAPAVPPRCSSHPRPRTFRPHLTLARRVRAAPRRPPPVALRWEIRAFSLMQSDIAPPGAGPREEAGGRIYRELRRWPLSSGGEMCDNRASD